MRHKYSTEALVLSRTPLAEAGMLVTLLTSEFGLIRARAEGVRRSGAKLAHALQTLNETEIILVRGKEGWRLTGALLSSDHFTRLDAKGRSRVARVASLLTRLVSGEVHEPELHALFTEFVRSLPKLTEEEQDAAESLIALRILHILGFDPGPLPFSGYGVDALTSAREDRTGLIARINRGITASGI
ncbi:MAG: recombination protein O N-terminal domain-containing protein [Patescibacteria group bacterium]